MPGTPTASSSLCAPVSPLVCQFRPRTTPVWWAVPAWEPLRSAMSRLVPQSGVRIGASVNQVPQAYDRFRASRKRACV
jgi:hypothetical protein